MSAADAESNDSLILVDSDDREIGYLDKERCHDGDGVLHRAFSVLLFDAEGRCLLQRRATGKRLWPGYWSNACCSHPRHGESIESAVTRRLREELGLDCGSMITNLERVFAFEYRARFEDRGTEHELCHVFVGRLDRPERLAPQPAEIAELRWLDREAVERELPQLTPWFRQEWRTLAEEHPARFESVTRPE